MAYPAYTLETHTKRAIEHHKQVIADQAKRLSELMGAVAWLQDRFERNIPDDTQASEVFEKILHREPRLIAADIKAFRHRYLGPDKGEPDAAD